MKESGLQETSLDVWRMKYKVGDEASPKETMARVAKALAKGEPEGTEEDFLWALSNGATPAGRIMANIGSGDLKKGASTINCTVMGTIHDSMTGILESVKSTGETLAAGCGIGICGSTIRPRGAYVSGVGATTSGAVSFLDIWDSMCFTVSSAGGRRGK